MTVKAEHGRAAPSTQGRSALALWACVGYAADCGDGGGGHPDAGAAADAADADEDTDAGAPEDDAAPVDSPPLEPSWGAVVLEDALSLTGDAVGACHVESTGKVL